MELYRYNEVYIFLDFFSTSNIEMVFNILDNLYLLSKRLFSQQIIFNLFQAFLSILINRVILCGTTYKNTKKNYSKYKEEL